MHTETATPSVLLLKPNFKRVDSDDTPAFRRGYFFSAETQLLIYTAHPTFI